MLNLLQTGNVGRLIYMAALALILAFDFAKEPIQDYLSGVRNNLQETIYTTDGAKIREAHEALISELRTGGKPIDHPETAERFETGIGGVVASAVAMEAKSSAVGAAYLGGLAAIGFASLIALIWLVFARVRDIGWPAAIGFAVLAPALAMRLFGPDIPLLMWDVLLYGFVGALALLGFVPSGFGRDGTEPAAALPGRSRNASSAASKSFGQRI